VAVGSSEAKPRLAGRAEEGAALLNMVLMVNF